ncbi:hypothetical protein LEP1GSC133_3472 [Leptospira borgpetersenii serovar Pomona str. 200901868]|uniref:Uncharacterized protein n=1 Tax=Leptospira borgpetersenii serovar Pomona str. 200901868 TaxID=1192866 RepID=M6W229_LEPBO|nr:hypothetical protein LEP1GSC133_3472 [Leptospira borgpetersenii serovar Pomona str. 200901868]
MNAFLNFKPLFLFGLGVFLLVFCARQHSAVDNEELAFKQSILALQKQIEEANRSKILSTELNEDGSFITKVRSASYDVWIKYNFANKTQAFVPDTSGGWDVGFQRFKLQTNGGLTYLEGQGGACLTNPVLTDFNVAASSTSRALGCTNAFFLPTQTYLKSRLVEFKPTTWGAMYSTSGLTTLSLFYSLIIIFL